MTTDAPTLPVAGPADHSHNGDLAACPTFRMLPQELQDHATNQPHLWSYLHSVPVEDVGVPEYFPTLGRSAKDIDNPNLIYPVSSSVFIHILADPTTSRDNYIPIEPGHRTDQSELMDDVETRLVEMVNELEQPDEDATSRGDLLLKIIDRFCVAKSPSKGNGSADGNGNGNASRNGKGLLAFLSRNKGNIVLDATVLEALRYTLVRDKEGLGLLQALIDDPYIEDISCSGEGPLFVEHKIFDGLKASVTFDSHEQLDNFVIRLSEKIGKPVSFRDPIVDATLPDGSRINIVYGGDLSRRGSNFTIRKFSETPLSILELIEFGTLSYEAAAYLSLVLGEGLNMFVAGETASGKTTLMNALTTFIAPAAKIVSIEDTPELQVPHGNWIREVVRGSSKSNSGSAVTMFDLLKAALRQRPNEIIIGEIRGEEGAVAFQAMQTGHAAMATFHAASVEKLIQRMTGHPINVPKTYIDNLNIVVIQGAVRLPNGKAGRRVLSINEIIEYDSSSDSFSFIEVFRWDPVLDRFEFAGHTNSFMLEHKLAPKRGLSQADRRKMYDALTKRANILKKLHDQGVTNFDKLYAVLSQAYRQGLFR